jgi:hypothetical protein
MAGTPIDLQERWLLACNIAPAFDPATADAA